MIDIHIHITPGVDDGATDIDTSLEMLKAAIDQGIKTIIATPHHGAFFNYPHRVHQQFHKIEELKVKHNLPVEICLGSEIYCEREAMPEILEGLEIQKIPSLNETKYVLAEFWYPSEADFEYCLQELLDNGWIPIIAHAERYPDISMDSLRKMKAAGCFIQINVYSIVQEGPNWTRTIARNLLNEGLVDFLGSDAHGVSHRPIAVEKGIRYLYEHYEHEYVDAIAEENAKEMILLKKVLDNNNSKQSDVANIWRNGIMGVIVGDALGVPVQFHAREERDAAPVTDMIGFGTFHLPAGSWSDDGSMTMATLQSVLDKKEIDCTDIMENFADWLLDGRFTPFGESFDQGNTCVNAIKHYLHNNNTDICGVTGEYANGNGALMRIMPVCLLAYEKEKAGDWTEEKAIEQVHKVSALTHDHLRSKIACGIYYFLVKAILDENGALMKRLTKGVTNAENYYRRDIGNYTQLAYYGRIFDLESFQNLPRNAIKSSGYVVDTLEAAIWCLVTTESFSEALLKAVNLGEDTDTIAAIAGGLAGLYYGYEEVPKNWLEQIQRREWIEDLCRNCTKIH